MCRCALQTLPLFYLLHCAPKFALILIFFYDLVSRDVTVSTVIFLERNCLRNHEIEADLRKLHITVQLHNYGRDSIGAGQTRKTNSGVIGALLQ